MPVLTCGDPSGIGPELAAKARALLGQSLPFAWIGDPRHLPDGTPWALVDTPAQAATVPEGILPCCTTLPGPGPARPAGPGQCRRVISAIARAVNLVRGGQASALCTAPIHKKALKDGAGFAFPGHTEYLAHLAGVDRVVMMLACPALRVVPATIHIPLADVPAALTPALLEDTIRITHAGLIRDFGLAAPRLVVAGLNPHAGKAARWAGRMSG